MKRILNIFLYPANTWPHKNHIKLIQAFKIVREKYPQMRFVCSGHQTNYFDQVLNIEIVNQGLESSFTFVGILSQEELYNLYLNALAVVNSNEI